MIVRIFLPWGNPDAKFDICNPLLGLIAMHKEAFYERIGKSFRVNVVLPIIQAGEKHADLVWALWTAFMAAQEVADHTEMIAPLNFVEGPMASLWERMMLCLESLCVLARTNFVPTLALGKLRQMISGNFDKEWITFHKCLEQNEPWKSWKADWNKKRAVQSTVEPQIAAALNDMQSDGRPDQRFK